MPDCLPLAAADIYALLLCLHGKCDAVAPATGSSDNNDAAKAEFDPGYGACVANVGTRSNDLVGPLLTGWSLPLAIRDLGMPALPHIIQRIDAGNGDLADASQ